MTTERNDAPGDLSDAARRYWFLGRAHDWASIARLASSRNGLAPGVGREIEAHLWGAHMAALALRHLHRCLELLDKMGLKVPEAHPFREAYRAARVTDLRDVLEHEENRVSGIGLSGKPQYTSPYPEAHMTSWSADRLRAVEVLGDEFDISAAVDAATALRQPLLTMREAFASAASDD